VGTASRLRSTRRGMSSKQIKGFVIVVLIGLKPITAGPGAHEIKKRCLFESEVACHSRRQTDSASTRREPTVSRENGVDPEQEALLAGSVGLALLVILETLSPVERVPFVLHDLFHLPFDEIAPIVGRSPTAAGQLANRARRQCRERPRYLSIAYTGRPNLFFK
jgi:hypothetical protein